jgi:predicted RecB family nuclease
MNINFAVDKAYEGKSFKELADSPVSVLSGISQKDAQLLEQAFGVKTISDLARLKQVRLAQAITALAESEQ